MPLRFLTDLPREIRDLIYGYTLGSSTGVVILLPNDKKTRKRFRIQEFKPWSKKEYTLSPQQQITFNLHLACKQTYSECKGLFWKLNRVWLSDVQAWIDVNEIHARREELEKLSVTLRDVGGSLTRLD
jgi:hypothetical protein